MSAQGGTLARRGWMQIPIWPVVALGVATTVALIGLEILQDRRPAAPVASIEQVEGYWSSTVGHPALRRGTALDVPLFESSTVVREQGAGGPFHAVGRAHEVVFDGQVSGITSGTGLENPGTSVTSVRGGSAGPAAQPDYRNCDYCHQRI